MGYYLLLVVRILTIDRCRIRQEAEKCDTDERLHRRCWMSSRMRTSHRCCDGIKPKTCNTKRQLQRALWVFFTMLLILISITAHSRANHSSVANSNTPMENTQAVLAIYTASASYLPKTTSTARRTGVNLPWTSSPADGKSP